MTAEWNVYAIPSLNPAENLRNTCRQLEQTYVDWHALAVFKGSCLCREWPAIGELGRMGVEGVVISFETTRKRSLLIKDSSGTVCAEVKMKPGLAKALYDIAFAIAAKVIGLTTD